MKLWPRATLALWLGLMLSACAVPGHNASVFLDVQDYLGSWTPENLSARHNWTANFVVAQDGSGTHRTIQSAINDLPSSTSATQRLFILVKEGVYRETICARDKAPFTLFSKGDPKAVVVVEGRYSAMSKHVGQAAHPCIPALQDNTYGTFGSTSVAIFSDRAHLVGFTIANDAMDGVKDGVRYPPGAGESGGAQAVALSVRGDRIQLHDMRLVGHQDTFFVDKTPVPLGRTHVSHSMIAGDVDFIFGGGRLVIENSLIVSRAGRRTPGNGGHVLAPSTDASQDLGFLVTRSRLLGQSGLSPGTISLGRPWDHGVKRGEWQANQSPNGQALIRDSQLGEHLGHWGKSTSGRAPEAQGHAAFRMHTFNNGHVKAIAPQDLP